MRNRVVPALMALGLSTFALTALNVTPSHAATLDDVLAELRNLRRENAEIRSELSKLRRASTPRETVSHPKPATTAAPQAAPRSVALREAPPVYSGVGVSPRSVYPPVHDGVYDWGGFYMGFNIGYGTGNIKSQIPNTGSSSFLVSDPVSTSVNGPFGGVQMGYNFQQGPWVAGIEGDVQYGKISGPATISSVGVVSGGGGGSFVAVYAYQNPDSINMFATLRGRLGYAFDRFLPYITGGVAVGMTHAEGSLQFMQSGLLASGYNKPADQYVPGWVLGGGFEYGLSSGWSVKAEYLHLGFQEKHAADDMHSAFSNFTRTKPTLDLVRGGMNYRF
jgi:outer membrane immunogenic protein